MKKKVLTIFLASIRNGRHCKLYKNLKDTITDILVYQNENMTAEIFEQVGSKCSKDILNATIRNLMRCGPPAHVTFKRHSEGRVNVNAQWSLDDAKLIESVCVRHREAAGHQLYGHGHWRQTCCQSATGCHLADIMASPVLEVQVACNVSKTCSQCPWGHLYTLPPALTRPPENLHVVEDKMADTGGQRMISLTWMFSEAHDGFNVSVAKASGEGDPENVSVLRPPVTLLLSASVFYANVSAFNSVSESPVSSITLTPQNEDANDEDDDNNGSQLKVLVHNQTSFSVSWADNLVRNYECFCLEWGTTYGPHPPYSSYKSFYKKKGTKNVWTLVDIPDKLQKYTSYDVQLLVRDQIPPCNLKKVNNSLEFTRARTRFYFQEGSPASSPTNITVVSNTSSSLTLHWSPIPQVDRRGFLLGYVIYYAELEQLETNVTVGPRFCNYTLEGLRSQAVYRIQMSGLTRAGSGVRSAIIMVETRHAGLSNHTALIIAFTFVMLASMLTFPLIRRAKVVFWPQIPNPEKSRSMQKLSAPTQLLLQPVDTLTLEEHDALSLLIVELRVPPPENSRSVRGLCATVDEQRAANSHDFPVASGYTSLDVIQQLMKIRDEGRSRGQLRDAV
ncbi:oncostatin-M-specific receptor subunit beta isoform X2 [Corythoichthys intestinalis]|uniref:oncostatin-M-specific receptor subunit beta isoform X2 n=1 Tax=Corythoichthys intestinalis TaxID=161448 RepID=UPI0025A4DA00|nr:oncostatin-M-specific receptor subunit beta isoform X2 [Corythoichthys intestinalis]